MNALIAEVIQELVPIVKASGFKSDINYRVGTQFALNSIYSRDDGYCIFISSVSENVQYYYKEFGHDQKEYRFSSFKGGNIEEIAKSILDKAIRLQDKFSTEKTKQAHRAVIENKFSNRFSR